MKQWLGDQLYDLKESTLCEEVSSKSSVGFIRLTSRVVDRPSGEQSLMEVDIKCQSEASVLDVLDTALSIRSTVCILAGYPFSVAECYVEDDLGKYVEVYFTNPRSEVADIRFSKYAFLGPRTLEGRWADIFKNSLAENSGFSECWMEPPWIEMANISWQSRLLKAVALLDKVSSAHVKSYAQTGSDGKKLVSDSKLRSLEA